MDLGDQAGRVPLTVWPAGDANRDQERELAVAPDYQAFRRSYQRGTQLSVPPSAPQVVSVDEEDRLVVWPTPDVDYRMDGTYRRSAQVLVDDDDTPIVEDQFHNSIMWRAVEFHLQIDETENQNSLMLAQSNARKRLGALRRRYLPIGKIAYQPIGQRRSSSIRRVSSRAPG